MDMAEDPRSEMQKLGASYRRAKSRYEDIQGDLVKRIPAWDESGIRQHEIVAATGLTREYIRQIVEKARLKAAEQAATDS
jgi:hypothetical protein